MTRPVMTAAATQAPSHVRLAEPIDIPSELAQAESAGYLPVLVDNLAEGSRGRLAFAIEEAIELALSRRGASPSGVTGVTTLEGALADQLYRARLIEHRGIALALNGLRHIASLSGLLDAEDSAVIRWWLDASERTPIRIFIDRASAALGVYGPPRPLAELLERARPAERLPEEAQRATPQAPPAPTKEREEKDDEPPALVEAASFPLPPATTKAAVAKPAPPQPAAAPAPEPNTQRPAPAPEPNTQRPAPAAAPTTQTLSMAPEPAPQRPAPALAPQRPAAAPAPALQRPALAPEPNTPRPALQHSAAPLTPPEVPKAPLPPLFPNANERWRTWAAELSSARGKQMLTAIERMFVSSYIPLSEAARDGIADRESEDLLARWAKNFARSYEEAFHALRLHGRRPNMVLDAPEIALRIAKLHGARSVQLLLIDALRFDLGLRVEQRVRAALGQQVALAERLVLWSALPTRSEVQIELIGRGPEGLSTPIRGESAELVLARGRASSSLRRVKTFHRELLKLDVVGARLTEPGPPETERLDALADESAAILSDYLARQAPRTLIFAFGDHGFLLERQGGGTRAAREGGSSPEEVLVPAFAWLVGGVH